MKEQLIKRFEDSIISVEKKQTMNANTLTPLINLNIFMSIPVEPIQDIAGQITKEEFEDALGKALVNKLKVQFK